MKLLCLTLGALGLVGAVYFGFRSVNPSPAPRDMATLHEGALVTSMRPEDVFKRGLWRRPAPDDRILHAERREWIKESAHGAAYWQWFLAVEPGPALRKWLRERNPFSVQPGSAAVMSMIEAPPEWFPKDLSTLEIHSGGRGGRLVLLWSQRDNMLYATDSGTGFSQGAPEPVVSAPPVVTQGRLPPTPPPTPEPQ